MCAAQGLCLIIEGDLDVRYLLALTLKRLGFDVQAVSSGVQGVAAAWEHRPVLVIVDMELPDMAGLDVARRILRHSDAAVLMIGGGRDAAGGLACQALERVAYLPRPVKAPELIEAVAALFALGPGPGRTEDS
jgi:two-component system KDP operon response regulator KdpE